MKKKTSITLSGAAMDGINAHDGEFRSRSEFIEAAVGHFIAHLDRQEAERRDLEILNRRADALNKEAKDVLAYQVPVCDGANSTECGGGARVTRRSIGPL